MFIALYGVEYVPVRQWCIDARMVQIKVLMADGLEKTQYESGQLPRTG